MEKELREVKNKHDVDFLGPEACRTTPPTLHFGLSHCPEIAILEGTIPKKRGGSEIAQVAVSFGAAQNRHFGIQPGSARTAEIPQW
mgnify:CR=1 FL=1